MPEVTKSQTELRGILLAVGAAVAFGTLAISAKFAYREGASPIPLLATRFLFATVLLAFFLRLRRAPKTTTRPQRARLILLGAFGYGFEALLFFAALENAPAGVVGLVFYSYPLWTAFIGFATRLEAFRPQLVIALALGSAGVALVFSLPQTSLKGPALALAAAVAVAIYLISIQVAARGVPPASSALWTSAGAALALTTLSLATGRSLPSAALLPAFALGVASSIAFVMLYGAIARLGSSRAAVATMLEPVTTVILGAIFLDEVITSRIIVGAALVVSALPVLAITGDKPHVESPPLA